MLEFKRSGHTLVSTCSPRWFHAIATGLIVFCFLLMLPTQSIAIESDTEESDAATRFTNPVLSQTLDTMDTAAKIDYINDHYYHIYSADLDLAQEMAAKALRLSVELGDEVREGISATNAGLGRLMRSDLEQALEHFIHAQRLLEKHNHLDGLKKLSFEMSVLYRRVGNIERSMELLDFVERVSRETNDDANLTRALGQRGSLHAQNGEYDLARPYYEEVYKIRLASGDSVGLGYAVLDMASLELYSRNFPEAYRLVQESIDIRRAIGDRQGVAISTLAFGETLSAEGRHREALPYYENAMRLASALQYHNLMNYIYDRFVDIYRDLSDYKSALEYKERSVSLRDSLFNVERSRIVEEMNARYETERRDRLIAELEREREVKDLTIQRNRVFQSGMGVTLLLLIASGLLWQSKVRQRELEYRVNALELRERMQQERERISRDLHDHVGAQLVNIISGLSLAERAALSDQAGKKSAPDTALLESLRSEAQSTIKQLRDTIWTLSSEEITPDAFRDYLDNYLQQYRNMTGLSVQVNYPNGFTHHLSPAKALNMFRIIQEALQNTVKHAGAGKVDIRFELGEDMLNGSISDDGTFKIREESINGGGSGLKNMEKRALEVGGTLSIEGDEKGTRVRFSIPVG